MSTYTQILYQIVFSTKNRKKTLTESKSQKLLNYIWGIIKNHNCHLYRINCVEDHVHILTDLHPSIALSDLIKDIKVSSSKKIKEEKLFDNFDGWQRGYGAFTYSIDAKDNLIEYIVNQQKHHEKLSFEEEYKNMLNEYHVEYDDKYFE